MAINFVRNIITSGYNLVKINENFVKIQTALQDGLSRSGNSPNQMNADLDMNGNNILNITGIGAESIVINGMTAEEFLNDAVVEVTAEAAGYAQDAQASATAAAISENASSSYAEAASVSFGAAQDLVQQATSGFVGFIDGLGYDFGSITSPATYFNQDWGSVA